MNNEDKELERKVNTLIRSVQDASARTQHHREHDGWGYEKSKAEDNANDIYYTGEIMSLIQDQRALAAREELTKILEYGDNWEEPNEGTRYELTKRIKELSEEES